MMEQDTRVDGTELYTIENRSSFISNTERAESANEDEMGHGWVPVGRLDSERYSEANFTVLPNAKNRDGTIKPHEIIRARWSVSLRPTAAIWKIGKVIRAQAAASCGAASAPR